MTEQAIETLQQGAVGLGVTLKGSQLAQFREFLEGLRQYSQHTNLVANADAFTVVREHVLDSLSLVPIIRALKLELPQSKLAYPLIDIGTGAGFPGLPLAIACEEIELALVESIGKKTRFLEQMVTRLSLSSRVKVITCRAETLAHESTFRQRFALATSRAVSTIDVVAELCLPFLFPGGFLLLQKSQAQLNVELARAKRALPLLNAELKEVITANKTVLVKERVVMVVKKTAGTKENYPRSAAQIKRKPLGVDSVNL